MAAELPPSRRDAGETGGTWALDVNHATGPFDVSRANRPTDEPCYTGRLVRDPAVISRRCLHAPPNYAGARADTFGK